jgi:hypothetical protein
MERLQGPGRLLLEQARKRYLEGGEFPEDFPFLRQIGGPSIAPLGPFDFVMKPRSPWTWQSFSRP